MELPGHASPETRDTGLRKYCIAIVITREALTNIPMVGSSAFDW